MGDVVLVVLAAGLGERFGGLKQLAPVGPGGETLMDYSIQGAAAAGTRKVVVVIRSEIEAPIRDHFDQVWSDRLAVEFVEQPVDASGKPGGTAMAVLACRRAVGDDPFLVINADDLYLPRVVGALHRWLSGRGTSHALVGFPLTLTVLPRSGPVTRALCTRRSDGGLAELIESTVERRDNSFTARPLDGRREFEVEPAHLVSMNAWGFRPTFWSSFAPAAEASHPAQGPATEVFLPVVVTGLLEQDVDVAVLPVDEPCIGVTWADDLEALQKTVDGFIERGTYPRRL